MEVPSNYTVTTVVSHGNKGVGNSRVVGSVTLVRSHSGNLNNKFTTCNVCPSRTSSCTFRIFCRDRRTGDLYRSCLFGRFGISISRGVPAGGVRSVTGNPSV